MATEAGFLYLSNIFRPCLSMASEIKVCKREHSEVLISDVTATRGHCG